RSARGSPNCRYALRHVRIPSLVEATRVRTNVRSVSWESEKSGSGGQSSCPPPPRCGGLRTYFLAAQGLAGLHGFAAFFFAAFFAAGAHGFAAFLRAQGWAAWGAQGFFCWATAGSGAAASMPPTATIDPSVWSDFLRVVMVASSLLPLNIDVTSQPRRHGNQPVRHGTCQRGFDH